MRNKNNFPLFLGIAIAFGIFVGSTLNFPSESGLFSANKSEQKIKKLLQFIEQDYVDQVNTDEILDDVIADIISSLDPHSVYFPKDIYAASHENLKGNFEGIGVQFLMHNDSLVVTHVIEGGPSEAAGILAGDRILIANNDTLVNKNITSRDVVKVLKGPANTNVDLQVYRKDIDSILPIAIKRNKVPILSAEVAYMLNDSLGYLKLDRFAATSYHEVSSKLFELKEKGAKNLVFDLRQNGGGFIHVANAIIDEFLEDGKLIVFTKNNKNKKEEFFATEEGIFEKGKVYVLIDEGSASASEIFAGALQDNDKGVIIGRRSFGKGLVQQEMKLGDGSAVRLTIARYYTPTGRSIQKPYKLNDGENYAHDYQDRILSGELLSKDSIKVADSLKYTTPKGKVVYGGGGIIPDVFVPIDTTTYIENVYFSQLNSFTFEYGDAHRKEILENGFENFENNFDEDDVIVNAFLKEVRFERSVDAKKKTILKHYLRAFIARQVFDETAFYELYQKRDPMIQKVMVLESQNK
ncbi:S41 family peptidase [Flavicella marina]|uniref:S41 family peptidase n=1 Tax=Flavicella marina TaxID=1475951 RepID=UPI00126433E7|nr:S41 family peptidase [Flavicella marina]